MPVDTPASALCTRLASTAGILAVMHSLAALGQLIETPLLEGAACVGHAELFDPMTDNGADRVCAEIEALRICDRCPALAACRRWLKSLPDSQKPTGVVAGRVYSRHKTGGRVTVNVKPRAPRARVRA